MFNSSKLSLLKIFLIIFLVVTIIEATTMGAQWLFAAGDGVLYGVVVVVIVAIVRKFKRKS